MTRCCQSLDLLTPRDYDGSRAEKAYAVDDLCAETRYVNGDPEYVNAISADTHRHSRSHTNENMSPESRGTALAPSLESDYTAEYHGESQFNNETRETCAPQAVEKFQKSHFNL